MLTLNILVFLAVLFHFWRLLQKVSDERLVGSEP